MTDDVRVCHHVAPVVGRAVPVVFANVEFPVDQPPERIEIAGFEYVRADEPQAPPAQIDHLC